MKRTLTKRTLGTLLAVAAGCTTRGSVIDPGQAPPGDQTGFAGTGGSGTFTVPPTGPTGSATAQSFDPQVSAPHAPPPISGGTLRVQVDGRTAVAADPDRDLIYVVDLPQKRVTTTLQLARGDEPGRHVEDAGGRVHVVLRRRGEILSFDPLRGGDPVHRPVCQAPRGIAFDGPRNQLHVACAGGELVTLPVDGGAPVRTLTLEPDLRDVVVSGSRLYISIFRKAEILRLESDGRLGRVSLPSTEPRRPRVGIMSPAVAWRMIAGPKDQVLVAHQRDFDGEIGQTTSTSSAPYYGDECGGIVESVVSSTGLADLPAAAALSGVALPVDIALAPDGRRLALVAAGNLRADGGKVFVSGTRAFTNVAANSSSCYTPESNPYDRASTVDPADQQPGPVEFRQPSGEAVAVAFDSKGNVIVQTREPAALEIVTQRGLSIPLSPESAADTGHAIFHSDVGSSLTCASCHIEGGEDGRVWRFAGEGPRRTQPLRGGIMATLPFHWSGDVTSLDDLMEEVFVRRMSGPKLGPNRVALLAAWMNTIPAWPGGPGADTDAIERGRALFNSAALACTSCHSGTHLTNNSTVDVGSGGRFQVPSLLGLRWRPPYRHDGCATTLADRFARCADRTHAVVSTLARQEQDDILAFLLTL